MTDLNEKTKTIIEKLKCKLYEWWHGHPFLIEEEVDIIIKMRSSQFYKSLTEPQIRALIDKRIQQMYIDKFGKH